MQHAAARLDESDLESLFHSHYGRLCGVLERLVGDRAQAEELALEAFSRLWRQGPARTNLGGWLYRVAMNLGHNALRAARRRARYEEQAAAGAGAAHEDAAAELERTEERLRVRRVLRRISRRAASLLLLRHAGFSYREIAGVLGIAPGSVGALLARAEREFEAAWAGAERPRRDR